ncbi:MFS transporter [Caulobacter endophyticus]|uniref:MFS transporter n=1 Tax=Caulobacter endophyticus TaxID=2172652 RepID=A0A2T9JGZ2_9CAUL|nr:MFS transporter [Caulobacter endophyticus]PVM82971.1 MFS transporter [Caulobacter endophyticus]
MSVDAAAKSPIAKARQGSWGAVYALTLCVSALIASEFLPVSLLTPIASDLRITEGQAGQAIAISGAFAVITSLMIPRLIRDLDRRQVLLGLTGLMILSGLMVAFAPGPGFFMAGRALIGVVVGGFWSMSAATVMRLVPEADVPRALNLQYLTLPALPATSTVRSAGVLQVLSAPRVAIGMAAVAALFAGRFALFTYLRPFLEGVTRVGPGALSLFLLLIGLAGLVGSVLVGPLLRKGLRIALIAPPAAMAVLALALIGFGALPIVTAALLGLWGLISTPSSSAWWTWLSRTLPEDAEAGGGLMVAVIQLAITLGAGLGGLLVDANGYAAAFTVAALILFVSAALTAAASRKAA